MTGQLDTWNESSTSSGLYEQSPEALQPARITRSGGSSLVLLYDFTKRSFLTRAVLDRCCVTQC